MMGTPSTPSFVLAPPTSRDHGTREHQQPEQAVGRFAGPDRAAAAAAAAARPTAAHVCRRAGRSPCGAGASAAPVAPPCAAAHAAAAPVRGAGVGEDRARLDGVLHLAGADGITAVARQIAVLPARDRVQPAALDRAARDIVLGRGQLVAKAGAVARRARAAGRACQRILARRLAVAEARALAGWIARVADALHLRIGPGGNWNARSLLARR